MTEAREILSLEGVSKVYRSGEFSVTALDNANLHIHGGEIVAIMGPSGSGKTTLLTVAGALLRPTEGMVRICGIDVTQLNVRVERAGYKPFLGPVRAADVDPEQYTLRLEDVWLAPEGSALASFSPDNVSLRLVSCSRLENCASSEAI